MAGDGIGIVFDAWKCLYKQAIGQEGGNYDFTSTTDYLYEGNCRR